MIERERPIDGFAIICEAWESPREAPGGDSHAIHATIGVYRADTMPPSCKSDVAQCASGDEAAGIYHK